MRLFGRYGDNLEDCFQTFIDMGWKCVNMISWAGDRPMDEKEIGEEDAYEIAFQSLNYEHTTSVWERKEDGYQQRVSAMLSGDKWCDLLPINDWSWKEGKEDVLGPVIERIGEEKRNGYDD
jgi:hypothetical protein